MKDYLAIASGYIDAVLSDEISACLYVKQACQRQRDDLENGVEGFEFSEHFASRICQFVELLPHTKGKWAGNPLILEPWQIFLLTTIFGWVNSEGKRRFKTAYVEVPRKNGKTALAAPIGLYCAFAEDEAGSEVYAAAVNRDQAKIAWQAAKSIVQKCKPLQEKFGINAAAHSIFSEDSGSIFKPLSKDMGGNLDGLSVAAAICDEIHGWQKRDLWDVLDTATGSREQPLMFGITTAGFNLAGICYEQRSYVKKVLSQAHQDDEYFGIIYTIDDGDDWTQESSWIKANPNWGVSVNPDDIRRKARKAMETASAVNNFLTKHLNQWVSGSVAWMNMLAWGECEEDVTIDEYKEYDCWLGVDLASRLDIAAVTLMFRKNEDEWAMFTKCYLPEDAVHSSPNSQYEGWVLDGYITATDGNTTDYNIIENDIRDLCQRFNVRSICFDPYQATYMLTKLAEDGLPVLDYPNSPKNMSFPMAELERLIVSKRLVHDGNPALTWQMSNVVAKAIQDEYFVPKKEIPQNKIDSVVAAMMALGKALQDTEQEISNYEHRGVLVL